MFILPGLTASWRKEGKERSDMSPIDWVLGACGLSEVAGPCPQGGKVKPGRGHDGPGKRNPSYSRRCRRGESPSSPSDPGPLCRLQFLLISQIISTTSPGGQES